MRQAQVKVTMKKLSFHSEDKMSEREILKLLKEKGEMTAKEIFSEVGGYYKSVWRTLKQLKKFKIIGSKIGMIRDPRSENKKLKVNIYFIK